MSDFVKSATSRVPAERSQSAIIAVLTRYGASGFGFRKRGDLVEVTFHLPQKKGDDRTVQIPVNVKTVHAALVAARESMARRGSRVAPDLAQAERTAWRTLLLWIEASLMAVQIGAQSVEEAFFANLIVTTEQGDAGRMVDYIATLGAANGGRMPSAQRLLGSGQ